MKLLYTIALFHIYQTYLIVSYKVLELYIENVLVYFCMLYGSSLIFTKEVCFGTSSLKGLTTSDSDQQSKLKLTPWVVKAVLSISCTQFDLASEILFHCYPSRNHSMLAHPVYPNQLFDCCPQNRSRCRSHTSSSSLLFAGAIFQVLVIFLFDGCMFLLEFKILMIKSLLKRNRLDL